MSTVQPKDDKTASKEKYGYFLGCVMPVKMPWAEKATLLVSKHLGLDFDYMKETLCCIRPGVWRAIDPDWWLTLTSQNLASAEKQKITLVDSCNGCYISHYETLKELKEEPDKMAMVNKNLAKIGMNLSGTLKVRHFLEVLYEDVGIDKIRANIKRPLKLKITRHLGCHARDRGNSPMPRYFDEILKATGLEIIDTPYDLTCCGLLYYFSDPNSAIYQRAGKKIETAQGLGVDAFVIICSGCYDQFERTVKIMSAEKGVKLDVPIVHLSEVLALAFGYKPEDFGMEYCRPIPTTKLIEKLKEEK